MPKARRIRTNTQHGQSARVDKRQFAVAGRTEHVEIGAAVEVAAMDLIKATESSDKPILKKKEKQQLKHELFLQRLESPHSPYSKSHSRRLKRRAREQIASGLQDVALALPKLEIGELKRDDGADTIHVESKDRPEPPQKRNTRLIGEGKGMPLTEKQRKQVLKTEKIRQPLLLATPEFVGNPFKVLRTHAQNSLIKHDRG